MPSFGAFETVREVYSGPTYTVFSARKTGDPKTEYAVKVFSVRQLGIELESTELDPLLKDLEQACTERVTAQQKAAAASKFICPILERGQDERGVWYVTRYYPRSVNKLISGRVALTQAALWHIVYAIVQGAVDLKRTCGRSHGDIQASAVQISRSDRVGDADVVLSDPLPGGADEASRYERSDLRAVGRILLQLVLQREITRDEDFLVLLPIASSQEWQRMFGDKAEQWVSLCNRLLDPDLSLGQITLNQLLQELESLRVKPRFSGRQVAIASGVLLLLMAAAIVLYLHYQKGTLIVKTDPAGAEIKLKPEGATEYRSYGKTPMGGGGLTLKGLPKGRYAVRAEYAGLTDQASNELVAGGGTRSATLVFPYGNVRLTSTPSGAIVESAGKQLGVTPYTNGILSPGQQFNYSLRLSNHALAKITVVVPGGSQTAQAHTNLVQLEAGTASVEFTSRPEGVRILENGVLLCTTPEVKTLRIGRHTISAQFEDWPATNIQIDVVQGDNSREIYLPHGQARFSIEPAGATVTIGGKPLGRGVRGRPLRPGEYSVKVEQEGFYPTNKTLTIREGQTAIFSVALRPMLGFVVFTSEPPGAAIYDVATGKPLGNANAGEPFKQSFPPGKYRFFARLDDWALDPVTNNEISVDLGVQLKEVMRFNYVSAQFETEPPGAEVSIASKPGKTTPYAYYQKPGTISYKVELPDYYPLEGTTNLVQFAKLQVAARLKRREVALVLRSDPPGAEFYLDGARLTAASNDRYSLPWGTQTIVARYPLFPELPELDPATNTVSIAKDGSTQSSFSFNYGVLEITNIEPEAKVVFASKPITSLPATLFLKPGLQYNFGIDGGPEFKTNLQPVLLAAAERRKLPLFLPELHKVYKNGLGMEFEWIDSPDPRPGSGNWGDQRHTNGFWVGVYEVTQAQYLQVMQANPSAYKCPDPTQYPVENLTWTNAVTFCERLGVTNRSGKTWRYMLPSDDQYKLFAADADTAGKVTSQGMTTRRGHPEKLGSLKRNRFRLYDVVGNVAEWINAPPDPVGKGRFYRGGSYESPTSRSASTLPSSREANQDQHPTIGFRVVLAPET